jgi:hypothetical protein
LGITAFLFLWLTGLVIAGKAFLRNEVEIEDRIEAAVRWISKRTVEKADFEAADGANRERWRDIARWSGCF